MIWCTIDEKYISYLKECDSRIPNVNYGKDKYKPFFSPLFEKDSLVYVSQISSKKDRHLRVKENIDFVKIYDRKKENLLAVVNLNYMFPVPKSEIIEVKYSEIEKYRTFNTETAKSKYINLLKHEMKTITEKNIEIQALELYKGVETKMFLQKRCLNFKLLEEKALEWEKIKLEEAEKQKKEELKELVKEISNKELPRGNYNALTGNEIITPDHSSGDKRWLTVEDVRKHNIPVKENEQSTLTIMTHKEEEKLYVKPIEYYNVGQLHISKEVEKQFKPMKEKVVEKSKEKGQEIGD